MSLIKLVLGLVDVKFDVWIGFYGIYSGVLLVKDVDVKCWLVKFIIDVF